MRAMKPDNGIGNIAIIREHLSGTQILIAFH
jgi:hypothetical protein